MGESGLERARERAWIELNLDALTHNVSELRRLMAPGCGLMAVLKANAYGHGLETVGRHLDAIGVRAFAVATAEEGAALRRVGVRGDILIFGYTPASRAGELRELDLTATAVSLDHALELQAAGAPVKVHLEIDTGMHRFGVPWDGPETAERIMSMDGLEVTGLYTHLGSSDSLEAVDEAYTRLQIDRFRALTDRLRRDGFRVPGTHIQSTYGLLNYPELRCRWARIGVALYGVLSYADRPTRVKPDLRPVLSLRSRVVSILSVRAGEGVGYGRAFRPTRDSRVAAVSVGYCDGVPRALSGVGAVLIRGRRAPIVGRICMDELTADVTDIPDAASGDTVTVIGRDGDLTLGAALVAERAGSFTPELLGRLSEHLPTVTVDGARTPKSGDSGFYTNIQSK